jgi:hypothetical protein
LVQYHVSESTRKLVRARNISARRCVLCHADNCSFGSRLNRPDSRSNFGGYGGIDADIRTAHGSRHLSNPRLCVSKSKDLRFDRAGICFRFRGHDERCPLRRVDRGSPAGFQWNGMAVSRLCGGIASVEFVSRPCTAIRRTRICRVRSRTRCEAWPVDQWRSLRRRYRWAGSGKYATSAGRSIRVRRGAPGCLPHAGQAISQRPQPCFLSRRLTNVAADKHFSDAASPRW